MMIYTRTRLVYKPHTFTDISFFEGTFLQCEMKNPLEMLFITYFLLPTFVSIYEYCVSVCTWRQAVSDYSHKINYLSYVRKCFTGEVLWLLIKLWRQQKFSIPKAMYSIKVGMKWWVIALCFSFTIKILIHNNSVLLLKCCFVTKGLKHKV